MPKKTAIVFISVFLLLSFMIYYLFPFITLGDDYLKDRFFNNVHTTLGDKNNLQEQIIRVAIFDSIFRSPKLIYDSLDYEWIHEGTTYKFRAVMIDSYDILGMGDNPLTNENFDVVVIAASSKQFLHDTSWDWRISMKRFVSYGGGYVGICGGANEAALGFLDVQTVRGKVIAHGALEIANIYNNDQQTEEWQYAWREAKGDAGNDSGIPINLSINTNHPIFSSYDGNIRNLRWWAGPSLVIGDSDNLMLGDVTPLATYLEEPMKKAPIHKWRRTLRGWEPYETITTDIKNQYAAIATTYNDDGRIVLFGPHPEYSTWTNGQVNEFMISGRGWIGNKFVYNWTGQETSPDYNWWIIRRSVAWASGLDEASLPPIE